MTTYVPGYGPKPARGMIIGEAPGRTEVEQGRPFVGKSGILLDMALNALGLERKAMYVTNVVKFLPLDEEGRIRKPFPSEIENAKSQLVSEIHAVSPLGILALGKVAENFLESAGVAHWYAWHPAYVLRRHSGLPTEWLEQIRPWSVVVK